MAGILTDYAADKHKKVALGIETYTAPSSLQAAVYTSSAGIQTNNPSGEVNYTGYSRASISFDANGVNSPISFLGPPTQTIITHLGLIDVTASKILWAGALTTPKTLSPGEPLFFNMGDISISFDTIA